MERIGTISYGKAAIDVIRSDDARSVEQVCLNDLCTVVFAPGLLREDVLRDTCPSVITEDNNRYFAPIPEAMDLLGRVRKSKNRKKSIEGLLTLLGGINMIAGDIVSEAGDGVIIPVIYHNNSFKAKILNGRLVFNVTDMGKAHDKVPSVWFNLAGTRKLMEDLVREGKAPNKECLYMSTKGRGGETWIDSSLLIDYGRWISDDFGMWCDEILMKLFTEGSVRIEDISPDRMKRKRLNYEPQPYLPPATSDEAFQRCEEQHYIIEELRPKAEYYDKQVESREWFSNSFIANELNISIRSLNLFLEDEGVQVRKKWKWELSGKYRGIPLKVEVPYDNPDAKNPYNMRSVWTPYGRDYVLEIWRLRNG